MTQNLGLRHYASFRGEEVVVAGYHKNMNVCMVIHVNNLPGNEQIKLRQIASSDGATSEDFLVPLLQNEQHESGGTWFNYVAQRLHRNDGSVKMIPIKDLDNLEPNQKAFFLGYGASIREDGAPLITAPVAEMAQVQDMAKVAPVVPVADPSGLAEAIARLADTQEKILGLLEGQATPKRTVRKKAPAKRKPSARKAVDKTSAEVQSSAAVVSETVDVTPSRELSPAEAMAEAEKVAALMTGEESDPAPLMPPPPVVDNFGTGTD